MKARWFAFASSSIQCQSTFGESWAPMPTMITGIFSCRITSVSRARFGAKPIRSAFANGSTNASNSSLMRSM